MSRKKILLVGVILMIAGIIISFYGFLMMDFDYRRLSSDYGKYSMTQKSFELSSSGSINLLIDVSSADVYIKPSQDASIKINYSPERYDVDLSNNNLTIKKSLAETNKKWYEYIRLIDISIGSMDYRDIEIEIPKEYLEKLDVELRHGYISVSDMDELKHIEIKSRSSDIKLEGINAAEDMSIVSEHGNISISDISVKGGLNINSRSGNISVKNSDVNEGTLHLEHGNCNLNIINGKLIKIEGSSADIYAEKIYMSESISAQTRHGNIKINSIDSSVIDLETYSGNIRGNIDDYKKAFSISTSVKSGETNLSDSFDGSKQLKMKSSHGNINIEFKK